MAYDIYSEKGYVAPGPSIGGLRDLKKDLTSKKVLSASNPQLASLVTNGYSPAPIRLKTECMALMKKYKTMFPKGVLSTLSELSQAAAKCGTIVILHDHVS
jgi:hypothetical protein